MNADKRIGLTRVVLVYAIALAAALAVAPFAVHGTGLLAGTLLADIVATLVVFAGSRLNDNASIYDPYWSVAPPVIAIGWLFYGDLSGAPAFRAILVVALIWLWGIRLTYNWARGWRGLSQEDWRYRELRARSGRWYPLVDLFGIELVPTLVVFAGMCGVWGVLTGAPRGLNELDVVAVIVTVGAIVTETVADRQLWRFLQRRTSGELLSVGLWRYSRHPNYFGEVSFWWGLALFGLAAAPQRWWILIGPAAISALFLLVSIPWLDRRSLERRPDYGDYQRRTSALLPWPPKTPG